MLDILNLMNYNIDKEGGTKVVVITRKLIDELERLMTNGATQFLSGESRRLMIELRRSLYRDLLNDCDREEEELKNATCFLNDHR